jgi:hypothetical protein
MKHASIKKKLNIGLYSYSNIVGFLPACFGPFLLFPSRSRLVQFACGLSSVNRKRTPRVHHVAASGLMVKEINS